MSKLGNEMVSTAPSGKWTWNDETQTMEFTCVSISPGVTKKRKASKMPAYQELVKFSAKGGSSGLRKSVVLAELNAYKAAAECSQSDSISLENIKQMSVSLMQENEALPIPLCFLTVIKSKELDEFLTALLLYLVCFWQRKALKKRSNPLIVSYREQREREQQMTAEASIKLELAKKHLAICYSSLVLGQGFPQQHHMVCGRRRVSSTYSDRHLYEWLYSFFGYVAWVTFGRRDLKGIQTEIGRLLRHDMFIGTQRAQRNESEEEDEEEESISCTRKSRRKPGLTSVLTQCSPVMMSIIPSTQEKASVFQRSSLHKKQADKITDTDVLMEELRQQLASCSFGILGKPLSHLKHTTPVLDEAKEEDKGVEHEDDDDADENDNPLPNTTTTAEEHSSLSRAHTVTSRATTEAPLSDTD